jgi:hypothetical protein
MAERTRIRIYSEDWTTNGPNDSLVFMRKKHSCKFDAIITIDDQDVGILHPGEGLTLYFDDLGQIDSFTTTPI